MQYSDRVMQSLLRNAGIASLMLIAAAFTLRADSACIGDCGPGPHLSGISGTEDVEAGDSGFDIYFRPGLPTFSPSDSSDKQKSSSSDDYFVSGGFGDAGALQFDNGSGAPGSNDDSPGYDNNSGGSNDDKNSSLTRLFNSPLSGMQSDPSPMDPSPVPEPRYSGLAILGLGWAGFSAARFLKSRSEDSSAS